MSSPKARWFVEELDVAAADPFEAPVEEVGTKLDLRTDRELMARLVELITAEGVLDGAGVTCAIRMRRESVCSACPVSQAATTSALGGLCRVGLEQDVVLTAIAVLEVKDA